MKLKDKLKVTLTVTAITVVLAGSYIAFGAGDSNDPIISKSYLDETVNNIMTEVDQKIANAGGGSGSGGAAVTYKVVEVAAGKTVIGHEGTEMILRSGKATAVAPVIAGSSSGLVDSTAGLDLANGKTVQENHVYIVPRYDQRGFKMSTDGFLMIKGSYDIK